jgi:hypothetical protein
LNDLFRNTLVGANTKTLLFFCNLWKAKTFYSSIFPQKLEDSRPGHVRINFLVWELLGNEPLCQTCHRKGTRAQDLMLWFFINTFTTHLDMKSILSNVIWLRTIAKVFELDGVSVPWAKIRSEREHFKSDIKDLIYSFLHWRFS